MARKPDYVRYTGHAVFAEEAQLKRCQSFASTTEYTQEKLLELANKGNTEVVDESSVTATLEFNDYGDTGNFAALIGQGYYNSSRTNNYVLNDAVFDGASVDFIAKIASNDKTIERSIWLGNAYLTSVNMTYSVDGVATESYDYEGDFKRWLLNTYKNANSYKCDYSSATTAIISGSYPGGGGPGDISSSDTPIILTVNNGIVADVAAGDTINISFSTNNQITAVPALSLVNGDRIRLVTYKASTAFPELPSTPDGLGGLRKDMVDIYLWNPNTGSEEKVLRAQSCAVAIDLGRETKEELGNDKPYYRSLTRPIDITVTLELNESDLEIYAKLAGVETTFDASTLNSIDIDNFTRNNKLFIKLYKSETTHTLANLLKVIEIHNLSVKSLEETIAVGEDGSFTIDLSADNVIVSGTGVNPIL